MRLLRGVLSPWRGAGLEVLASMDAILSHPRRPWISAGLILLATMGAWFLYVPVHELMHALGCVATGGTVGQLQIARMYGGGVLARVLPFVQAGGEYAGRLTKFDTGGSDLVYLATDLAPFLLTVLGGFTLLRRAKRRRDPLLFGPGIVLAAAPVVSLAGDYYEMGSVLVSGVILALGGKTADPRALSLRHDDLVALLGEFQARFPDGRADWSVAMAAGALLGVLLAGATLAASRKVADLVEPAPRG